MVLFCAHSKSPNTAKIGVSPRKGACYLWYTKAMLCWKHYFIVFSAKHSFAEIKECKFKNINLPNIGACLPTCKKVFFCLFLFVSWCFFFVLVCFVLFCLETAKKGYFPAISVFCVPKRPAFKILLLFLFCLFSLLSLCPRFQNFILFLLFLSINPFLENIISLVSSVFFWVPLPLFMFACFFQTNFPNIPFLKPRLFSFLAV